MLILNSWFFFIFIAMLEIKPGACSDLQVLYCWAIAIPLDPSIFLFLDHISLNCLGGNWIFNPSASASKIPPPGPGMFSLGHHCPQGRRGVVAPSTPYPYIWIFDRQFLLVILGPWSPMDAFVHHRFGMTWSQGYVSGCEHPEKQWFWAHS